MKAPGQVQRGSGEGFTEGSRRPLCRCQVRFSRSRDGPGEGLGEFGAEPGQGFGEVSGAGRAEPGHVQQRARFNEVLEKVRQGFGREPGQV